jgi:hypothetical protein
MSKARIGEEIIHIIFWIIIYIVSITSMMPVMSMISSDTSYFAVFMHVALKALIGILPFLVLFIIHNHFIAPILLKKENIPLYLALTAILLTAFIFFQYKNRDQFMPGNKPLMEEMNHPGNLGPDSGHRPLPPDMGAPDMNGRPGRDIKFEQGKGPRDGGPRRDFPMSPQMLKIAVAILMLCTNLGLKYYYLMLDNRQKLFNLEKENLNQQLTYLRYQINPHFFMNTLNNIHALVDIDPEKAKESLVELSKLMRYILYEGSKPTIPLDLETEFLRQYIDLMRMRFSDSVQIDVALPDSTSGIEIPPLLFVSFVENAFKHGVSYEKESFINVSMAVEGGSVVFHCANSRHDTRMEEKSGIGMENVRRRLKLLYGSDFTLKIDETSDIYDILVVIPTVCKVITDNK